MAHLTSLGKALSDPVRVRVLNLLLQSEACVCEMVDALETAQPKLSTHLQTLRLLGLVSTEKRRTWIIYSLAPEAREAVAALFKACRPDEGLARDVERLNQRLGMRVDGCCVLGAGQLAKGA